MSSTDQGPSDSKGSAAKPPGVFKEFVGRFPALGDAHEAVAAAEATAGPLDEKTRELIKIGISIGAGLESAVRATCARRWPPAPPSPRSNRPCC